MQIRLDYAQTQHTSPLWLWVVLALAVLSSGAALWQYSQLQAERAGLALRLQASNEQPVTAPPRNARPNKGVDKLKEQTKQANLVLQQLGLPWPTLLEHLETTASPKVALLSVRPDAAKRRLRVSGEARQLVDVLQYIDALAAGGLVSDVVLEQHDVVATDAQKPVHFSISAHWGVS
ncbi:MAG: hypothetical protein ACKVN9_09725 [Methylophilaceae bacterium]